MGTSDLVASPLSPGVDRQPAPQPSGGAPIHALVVADLFDRCHLGVGREFVALDVQGRSAYGVTQYKRRLRAGNGRIALIDGYQEVLDAPVYLAQDRAERLAAGEPWELELGDCYEQLLAIACRVRVVLDRRARRAEA